MAQPLGARTGAPVVGIADIQGFLNVTEVTVGKWDRAAPLLFSKSNDSFLHTC